MSSYLARLWQSVRHVSRRRLVGKDLQGNSFYETILGTAVDGMKRKSKAYRPSPNESWRAAENMKSLPVQWTAWLTYSRQHPPTIEELVNDQRRQQKLAQNVERLKELERRRQTEAQARLRVSAQQTRKEIPSLSQGAESAENDSYPEAPPSKPIGPTAEPQTWVPSAGRRG
ncbi:hypothetical protein Clacol_009393 [Clathrus columnatus]|uniref:NADH dehydrogenase [ubiquinone] 1 alpha subcomplex subunit n=1 Tax=Clathrus columnatus TaxID=1419009 RepID=A0AAV5AR03_9AGAM|nr:hypothetical protein Clacol_009393 [Clathrus columnatus]